MSELKQLAEVALAFIRHDLKTTRSGTPVFVVRHPDGTTQQLPFPQEANNLMNIGQAKDIIFAVVREMVEANGYTAVVFGTEAWMGDFTPLGKKKVEESGSEWLKKQSMDALVEAGLVKRVEAIAVTVQTAETVLIAQQRFHRDAQGNVTGFEEPNFAGDFSQDSFFGRQKMYGKPNPTPGDVRLGVAPNLQ